MAFPTSGAISFSTFNIELGRSSTAAISFNDSTVRRVLLKSSGAISFQDAYGKAYYWREIATKGFWAGGQTNVYDANTMSLAVDKIDFSTETRSSAAQISVARGAPAAFSTYEKGFIIGGYPNSNVGGLTTAVADRITYSTESWSAVSSANYPYKRAQAGFFSNGFTKGFSAGGVSDSTSITVITTTKTDYITETTSNATSNVLTNIRRGSSGHSNVEKGFICGGRGSSPLGSETYTNTTEKFTHSTEVFSNVSGANLSGNNAQPGSLGMNTAGYTCGGYTNTTASWLSRIDKITYSTETRATISATLPISNQGPAGNGNNTKGFLAGGLNSSIQVQTRVDRLTYATDTIAGSVTTLSSARVGLESA